MHCFKLAIIVSYFIITLSLASRHQITNSNDINDLLHFDPSLYQVSGNNIEIAIIDTGVQYQHPALRNKRLQLQQGEFCVSFVPSSESSDCLDHQGHGTFVSSMILGTDDKQSGIAKNATLLSMKTFSDTSGTTSTSQLVDAMNYILTRRTSQHDLLSSAESRVTLIVLSTGSSDFLDAPFNRKLDEAIATGITVVTAAGNAHHHHSQTRLSQGVLNPADRLGVISVGGVKQDGLHLADASSCGLTSKQEPRKTVGRFKPDVVTFSENLHGCLTTGGFGLRSGTSIAAPIVAGALALSHEMLLKNQVDPNPGLSSILIWKSSEPINNTITNDNKKKNSSTTPELFDAQLASSFLGSGAGKLNIENLLEMSKRVAMNRAEFEIGFFPSHLNFLPDKNNNKQQQSFFPLSDIQLPLRPSSISSLTVQISVACGFSARCVLNFASITVLDENNKNNNREVPLDPTKHGLDIHFADLESSASTTFEIFPYFGSFSLQFFAKEIESSDQEQPIKITSGFINFNNERHKIPFRISHFTTVPTKENRILWIANHNLYWPFHFVGSDEGGFYFNDKHQHHSDAFEQSNDDPLGSGGLTYVLWKLRKELFPEIFVDVVRNKVKDFSVLLKENSLSLEEHFSTVIIFDPEESFSEHEIQIVSRAIETKTVSLVVVADWSSEKIVKAVRKSNPDRNAFGKKKRFSEERITVGGSDVEWLNERILKRHFGVEISTKQVFVENTHHLMREDHDGGNAEIPLLKIEVEKGKQHFLVGPIESCSNIEIVDKIGPSKIKLFSPFYDERDSISVKFFELLAVHDDELELRETDQIPHLLAFIEKTEIVRVALLSDSTCVSSGLCADLFLEMVRFAMNKK